MGNIRRNKPCDEAATEELAMGNVRRNKPCDEAAWLRCYVLSFLDSEHFDDVLRSKLSYDNCDEALPTRAVRAILLTS